MTLKVLKSQIASFDFAGQVADHVAALEAHDAHMGNVRAEEGKPANERTYEAFPAPTAHPLVDAAVRRVLNESGGTTFVADYDVEDDGPTPEEVLVAKRNALLAAVTNAETAARNAVIAPGKVRLHSIRARDAYAKKKEDRSAEDEKIIGENEALRAKLDAIELYGAMQHSEIEDLTIDTVDGWKLKEFP